MLLNLQNYYVNFNAENNNTYIAENANNYNSVKIGDGKFSLPEHSALLELHTKEFEGCSAVRCSTSVTNNGDKPFSLDILSSVFVKDIGKDGSQKWNDGRFILHYAHTAWQGEAQWRHVPLGQAGLYKTYNHQSQTSAVISSVGSWSTSKYQPLVMLEDTELHKTWYFSIETGSSWFIEIAASGQREDSSICVFVSDSCEKNDGWNKTINPGETYETANSVVGLVDGGFEEAVADITVYRRKTHLRALPNGVMPLCFNDYMNCLWALPTREKLIPLIDNAAKVGCEYFVIDAGWFGKNADWGRDLGDWSVNDSLFGEGGFKGIIDYIKSKGMKPGCWLEFESAGIGADFVREHPECVLKRRGYNIGKDRVFLDYTKSAVTDHIMSVFDMLYGLGIRFVKNDYNQTIGIGCDSEGGEHLSVGLRNQFKAVMKFIDRVHEKYPDLVIENCGSGAMRSDHGTLSHSVLQSVSDQEDYLKNPSVISGSAACINPERLGVWAYPYPVAIDFRDTFKPSEAFTAQFTDGYVTEFNMVSGLMGLIYLSGHIDGADKFNLGLISEATEIYKRNRKTVAESVPIYPTGTFDMTYGGAASFGLLNRKAGKLLLAAWSLSDSVLSAEIDLSKYADSIKIADVYPGMFSDCVKINGKTVSIGFKAPKTAVYIEADIK